MKFSYIPGSNEHSQPTGAAGDEVFLGDIAFRSGAPWFDVSAFGAVGDGVTDDSAAVIAAIKAAYVKGGGTVFFPPATYLIGSQIVLPNDGSSAFNNSPKQPSIRLAGAAAAGGLVPGGGGTPSKFGSGPAYGGSVLNLTYAITPATLTITSCANASGGNTVYTGTITGGAGNGLVGQIFMVTGFATNVVNNGAFVVVASTSTTLTLNNPSGVAETHSASATNSPAPKICTYGTGMLEIDHLTLCDTGSDSGTFFFTSNTTCHIHDVTFLGNTVASASVASNNDAIWLGNNNGSANGTFAAPFQGYGTVIENCYFQCIRRAVFGQAYCNGVRIVGNTVWSSSGDPNGAAIVLGTTSFNSGADSNYVAGNVAEVVYYKWFLQIVNGSLNKIIGNDNYDPTGGTFSASVRCEAFAYPNFILGGFSAGYPYLSDVPVTASIPSENTCLGPDHIQPNIFHSPIAVMMIATSALTAGQVVKIDPSNPNAVIVCTTTDTGAGLPIGIAGNSASAGGSVYVIVAGLILSGLTFSPVLGTGTASPGQFVIVDTTTNGRVKATSTYAAGTVIGTVVATQSSVGSPVGVLVGIR